MKNQTYLLNLAKPPQITIDAYNLISHFYANSPTLSSRALGVVLKYSAQEFFLKGNALTKDGNPTVTNVIREGMNIGPLSYNVYKGEKHTAGGNETLEGIYLLGQETRLLCKLIPQYLSGGDVTYARILNIGCDSPSIIGNHLSKISQHNPNQKVYWFWKEEDPSIENIWVWNFIRDNATLDYIMEAITTAGIKAIILDQLGEVIKIVTQSPIVKYPYQYISSAENDLIKIISSSSASKYIDNLIVGYALPSKTLKEWAEKSITGELLDSSFSILNSGLPDLFITGTFMLSMSNDIVRAYNTATTEERNAIVVNSILLFTLKNQLISLATEALPYTLPILAIFLASDKEYNKFKNQVSDDLEFLYLKEQEYIASSMEMTNTIVKYLYTKREEFISHIVEEISNLPSNTISFLIGENGFYPDDPC